MKNGDFVEMIILYFVHAALSVFPSIQSTSVLDLANDNF